MTIKNYSSLSSMAKKKVKAAGYKPSSDKKTASRSSSSGTSSRKKSSSNQMATAQAQIKKNWAMKQSGNSSYQKQQNAVYNPKTQPSSPLGFSESALSNTATSSPNGFMDKAKNIWNKLRDATTPGGIPENAKQGMGAAGLILPSGGKMMSYGKKAVDTVKTYGKTGFISIPYSEQIAGIIPKVQKTFNMDKLSTYGIKEVSKIGTSLDPNKAIPYGKLGKAVKKFKEGARYSYTTLLATHPPTPKTAKLTTKFYNKVAKNSIKPLILVGAISGALGTYPWAGHLKIDNVLGGMNIAMRDALIAGDSDAASQINDMIDEFLEPTLWEKIQEGIPFVNVLKQVKDQLKVTKVTNTIYKKIIDDEQIAIETGETEADKWARARAEQAAQEQQNIDYYNQERQKMVEWENEAASQARDEDAKYWAKERAKQLKQEEKDREAIADFWLEYRIKMEKISTDNTPSNLKFGLL